MLDIVLSKSLEKRIKWIRKFIFIDQHLEYYELEVLSIQTMKPSFATHTKQLTLHERAERKKSSDTAL